jgi:hypothetical protein
MHLAHSKSLLDLCKTMICTSSCLLRAQRSSLLPLRRHLADLHQLLLVLRRQRRGKRLERLYRPPSRACDWWKFALLKWLPTCNALRNTLRPIITSRTLASELLARLLAWSALWPERYLPNQLLKNTREKIVHNLSQWNVSYLGRCRGP